MAELKLNVTEEMRRLALIVAKSHKAMWEADEEAAKLRGQGQAIPAESGHPDGDGSADLALDPFWGNMMALEVEAKKENLQFFPEPAPNAPLLTVVDGVITTLPGLHRIRALKEKFDILLTDLIVAVGKENGIELNLKNPCCEAEVAARNGRG